MTEQPISYRDSQVFFLSTSSRMDNVPPFLYLFYRIKPLLSSSLASGNNTSCDSKIPSWACAPLTVYRIAANTVLREVGVHVINELSVSCVIVVLSALGLRSRDIPHLVRQWSRFIGSLKAIFKVPSVILIIFLPEWAINRSCKPLILIQVARGYSIRKDSWYPT